MCHDANPLPRRETGAGRAAAAAEFAGARRHESVLAASLVQSPRDARLIFKHTGTTFFSQTTVHTPSTRHADN